MVKSDCGTSTAMKSWAAPSGPTFNAATLNHDA